MTHLTKKINQLKWLQTIGIDYYLSESTINQQKIQINSNIKAKPISIPPALPSSNTLSHSRNSSCPIWIASSATPPRNDESTFTHTSLREATLVAAKQSISNYSSDPSHSHVGKKPEHVQKQDDIISLSRTLADSARNLEELKKLLMDFDGCGLKKLANKTVFADGNPQSSIMFIGEAPGSSEDAQGIPFCGESGKLLDNVLASINISREHNAYITNTVFWRPPANRQPTQEEIDICRPFVEKHIALINPKLIVLVGNVAATSLLGKNAGISKIRLEYYLYTNQYLSKPIQTTSIFHPAYLLRQPMQKKTTWYDLLKIHEYINTSGI
ncbi:uracil-DNA glycosylase family protein [Candidatus Tisiphia endosymbiont of Parasteatoda lunata]|uniref:uracil-DNA glycosylase family protein n=1 Tax=Candidatus Tisiphia endosymbiont of Parasteatoda lunata TaxID=3066275 RepID=UPI00313B1634